MIYILVIKVEINIDSLVKIIILVEYSDYANNFLPKFTIKLLKYNNNNYVIILKKDK